MTSYFTSEAKMELQNLLKDSSKSPQAILQYIQDHKLQESALVLKLALPLWNKKKKHYSKAMEPSSSSYSSSLISSTTLSTQHLSLLEQIVMAALFEKKLALAEEALTDIKITAGANSLRYRKLLALCLEASETYKDALEIYNDMLTENPSNVYALKRKYVILRSQLLDLEARKCLNDYLEQNGSDATAWVEMAKTCMEQGDYKGAVYCYEEVALFSPMDANVHCILGELYVTIGNGDGDENDKQENYKWARKHFAQCLEFDKGHIRAMFGLVSATECYLEYMEKKKNASTGGSGSSSGNSSSNKKKHEGDDEDEDEEVEFVRDLRAHAVELLFKSYENSNNKNGKSKSTREGTDMVELLEMVFK